MNLPPYTKRVIMIVQSTGFLNVKKMYHIVHRDNSWHILKGTRVVLFGVGSIQTAVTIGRLYGIFLTFENTEIKEAA